MNVDKELLPVEDLHITCRSKLLRIAFIKQICRGTVISA